MAVYYFIKFLTWLFIVYGVTQIVVESTLFTRFRNVVLKLSSFWGNVVMCVLCTSVWVGFIMSMGVWSPAKIMFAADLVPTALGDPGTYENAWAKVLGWIVYAFLLIKNKIVFVFLDGMIAATGAWFMHVIEQRLLSGIKTER